MCGISGIYAYSESAPPVDREELLRTRDAMVKRGPDGAGLWIADDRRSGLAHRRLSIIDLSDNGAQPMATDDGRLRITFNGEIYNYRALRKTLEARGYRFRSSSDTEVLLHLYADRGEAMVHALRGMYAFAIWDERDRSLFLARDPFGIKPLYYADDGRTFRFASQVKALLKGGATPGALDAAGQVGFFVWGSIPEPFTLYKSIRALAAGSCMRVHAGRTGARESSYFSLADEFRRSLDSDSGRRTEHLLDALRDSVEHHLVADVSVGSFLSAGLDSGTITALAAGKSSARLHTVTLGFREYLGTDNDETGLAQLVSGRYGARHDTHWISREDFEAELDPILDAMDQPSIDGVNTYFVSKAAAAAGMKVAISGLGGDELFGGYRSFRDVPRLKRFAGVFALNPGVGKSLRRALAPLVRQFTSPKYAGALEYGGSYGGAYLLRRALFMPWELPEVVDPQTAAEGWEALQSLAMLEQTIRGVNDERHIVSALELSWYMRNQLLRDSDWAGMAHSLEIRVPYVDVPFFRAVAPLMHRRHAPTKSDMALRLDPPMPAEAVYRSKTGFVVPLREWCMDVAPSQRVERGLRGWARMVMQRTTGTAFAPSRAVVHALGDIAGERLPASPARPRSGEAAQWVPSPLAGSQPRARRILHRTQARLIHAVYRWINTGVTGLVSVLWPGPRPTAADRVCIFRIGNIGDITCALPAIRCVRLAYPHARLTLLTSPGPLGRPGAADLQPGLPWIDEVLVYHSKDIATLPKRLSLLRELRARRFDVWIELPNNLSTVYRQLRDIAFTRMLGVRWGRGWQFATIRWAGQAQSEYLRFPNEVERLLAIVRQADIDISTGDYGLCAPPSAAARADAVLHASSLRADRLIAIAPGCKRSANAWLEERFREVARAFVAEDYDVVFVGGASEAAACADLARGVGDRARSFAGELSVIESCGLLKRCRLLIAVDSGVQHLAAALGTPCVSLFSFREMLGKWRPSAPNAVVIQKWVPCHSCLLDDCPRSNRCMQEIQPAEVLRAAMQSIAA